MNKINSFNKVDIYEINHKEVPMMDKPVLSISNHWAFADRIVLSIKEGETFTVLASDLFKAIKNATNV